MILFVSENAFAIEKITDNQIKTDFAYMIRKNSYRCSYCKDVYLTGEDYRGFIYKVICNDNVLAFTLIVNKNGKFIVNPL